MKTQTEQNDKQSMVAANNSQTSCYQVYCQTRTGAYQVGFNTDSPVEAVEAFLTQRPAFEGGEIRLWNRREQRIAASVVWLPQRTAFGFHVNHRANIFHEAGLDGIAHEIRESEAIRQQMGISV